MTAEQKPTIALSDLLAQGAVQAPPTQLDQEAKESLAEAGTPLKLDTIQFGDSGEFGPYWQFEGSVDGKPVSFRLSSHEGRDSFIASLAAITATQSISGVRLIAIDTRGGNKFLTLGPA